ncbi:MAG: D-2-hydroxyacid dehydrogenase [Gammaproteobacteria bacterium]|nr:D-2-hydroxyacid dehydrogenase [Gammaproteobacteria bacterium]
MKGWLRLALVSWFAIASATASGSDIVTELGLREATTPVRQDPRWSASGPIVVRVDSAERAAEMQRIAGDRPVIAVTSEAEALPVMKEATALMGYCSARLLDAGPQVRWVQAYSSGAERCVVLPRIADGQILLTNMQRISGPEIAEHVIGMLLTFTRGLNGYARAQASGEWQPELIPMSQRWELTGRTMLVVGLGGIGTEVARRASALGMEVIAVRASGRPGPDFVAEVGRPDALLAMAGRADAVANTVPLTPLTRGMFDAGVFDAMPAHAYFLNVGRGGTVVTDDLVAALRGGAIAGAGLDVTDPEPLPAGHPLWSMPNVIITPHVSAGSDLVRERLFAVAKENLRRYVAGDPLVSVVDPERGY